LNSRRLLEKSTKKLILKSQKPQKIRKKNQLMKMRKLSLTKTRKKKKRK